MRFFLPLLAALTLAGCYPSRHPDPVQRAVRKEPSATLPAIPAKPPSVAPVPATAAFPPRISRTEISGIGFEGVEFDSRGHRLQVVDQPDGPGSRFPDAASAARTTGGIAAVNAGFFTPEGAPLGLVVQNGRKAGAWNSASSLGSGIWLENPAGSLAITRREALGRSAAAGMRELIQAGPLLVENGHSVSGLDAAKTSVRTLILWDGGHRWWIGRSSPCSLASIARTLAGRSPAGWPIRQALNLDGGRSADLSVSANLAGGPFERRSVFNRPVRNFLVLVAR